MGGFVFTILLFFLFLLVMVLLISGQKEKRAVYLTAVAATLSAWFIGLLLDANLDFGQDGFLALRIVLPILAMGLCILHAIMNSKPN